MHGLNTIRLLDPVSHCKHCSPDPDQTTLSILGMLRKSPIVLSINHLLLIHINVLICRDVQPAVPTDAVVIYAALSETSGFLPY